ncbi:MAG: hypothetical protein AMJ73_00345 [candidate division Zixibacteria bacterium SM1_73]|nr:MAG: hypothetical protein AMJ73_00345 [candidate division Zixibacteria bacterium SM1_73]
MLKRFTLILLLTIGIFFLAVLSALAESVDTAWVRRYNGPANLIDEATAIAVDESGNVYVTGHSWGGETSSDYATIKYDAMGSQLWVKRYNGPGNRFDGALAMAIDDYGNIYVTGYSDGDGTWADYATIKYDTNGNETWVRRYDGPESSYDQANAIAVDDSNNVYVTGSSWCAATWWDYTTVKYDPNGNEVWVRRYHGPGVYWEDEEARAIALDDSGNVYVTGRSAGTWAGCDYATVKYNSSGSQLWVARYNGPGNYEDASYTVAIDDYYNVYVTGTSRASGGGYDYATIKYDASGNELWVRRYRGEGKGSNSGNSIGLDACGNIFVTGRSYSSGAHEDYATIKYYPSGDTTWVRRYHGPGDGYDIAYALVVGIFGNVYVTGMSNSDYTTIKYDSSGNELWIKRYDGPGNGLDESRALTVDGSNNVYVTGYSDGSGLISDYATIKYVQGFSHISIVDFAFAPQVDTITIGDSVRWTNNGGESHTSTSDSKVLWDSGTLDPGESFTFQFKSAGSYPYHCEFYPSMAGTIVVLSTDVQDETGDREKPSEFALSQNYPNPFNQTTKIEFTLAKSGFVRLNIYDLLGRKVRTLVSEHLSSGYKSVLWDGKNDSGKDVASGIYFYQIKIENPASGAVGDFSESRKLVLLK